MANHGLTFGALDFNGGTAGGYTLHALAESASWGNPVPVEVTIRTLLQDGAVVAKTGDDNREAFLRIEITGTDSAALAAGESALVAEVGKRNELTWTPADGEGEPCAFDVWTSSLEHIFDDLNEQQRNCRVYGLRLVCAPYARTVDPVTVPALTSAGSLTTTLVDACSSATNWSQTGGTTFGVVSGAVQVSRTSGTAPYVLTRTSSAISMSTTPYLTFRIGYTNAGATPYFTAQADGVELELVAQIRVTTGAVNIDDITFYCPDTSITVIAINAYEMPVLSSVFYVDNINRVNQVPFTGTARQKARSLVVSGSVRAPGTLSIQHASSGLGEVLCYVSPDDSTGYRPDLRVRRTIGGTVSADTAQVSGSTEDIATLTWFEIPTSSLRPGSYALLARVAKISTGTARTVTWTAQAIIGGGAVGPLLTGETVIPASSAGAWEIHHIATLALPTLAVPAESEGTVAINLISSAGLSFDEGWLFDMTYGQLVWVNCGSGTPAAGTIHNRLWIDSPTVADPRPNVYVGTEADQGDAHYPADGFSSWQQPTFDPGTVRVHTVTTGALDADVAFEYYPRFHTHVVA